VHKVVGGGDVVMRTDFAKGGVGGQIIV